jgi:hypothetical protein
VDIRVEVVEASGTANADKIAAATEMSPAQIAPDQTEGSPAASVQVLCMTRAAAILAWISGVGFGLPAVFGLRHFALHHEVWTFMGFPTYGGGPFEGWGIPTSIPLLAGFIVVCVAELVVGVLLWSGRPLGVWLAIGLLPFELIYWVGFALPFGHVLGAIRTALVVAALMGR